MSAQMKSAVAVPVAAGTANGSVGAADEVQISADDFRSAIENAMSYNEGELAAAAQLIRRMVSVFENFNCNNRAARVVNRKLYCCANVLGHPAYGLVAKLKRKKPPAFPADLVALLENLLYDYFSEFIKYTYLDSLRYVLIGDNLVQKLDDFDEKLTDIVSDVVKTCQLDGNFFRFPAHSEFEHLVTAKIRNHVTKAATDSNYLLTYAATNGINVLTLDTKPDTVTGHTTMFLRPSFSDSTVLYNPVVTEIVSGGGTDKYTKEFVNFVVDLYDFSECLSQLNIDANFELQLSAHAAISQVAVRRFWARDVGKFEGVTVGELCHALRVNLSRLSQDHDTVNILVESFQKSLSPPAGSLFQLIDADIDSGRGTYLLDAVEMGKLVKNINPNETDLELVIDQLLNSDSRLQHCPSSSFRSKTAGLQSSVSHSVLESIEFVGVNGPVTASGYYVNIAAHGMDAFIDDPLENSLAELLFKKSVGIVEAFGQKGCGKSTLLLHVANKRNVKQRNIFWVDLRGVCTVQQAIARTISQLGLRGMSIGDDTKTFFQLLGNFLKSKATGSLVVFDNIDSGCVQQHYFREIPSKSQPLILFLWSLYDVCKEMDQLHRFIFVANVAISSCLMFKPNQLKSTSPAQAYRILADMKMVFSEQYQFPSISNDVLYDMATILCPVDPCSLLIASMGIPGEMVNLGVLCKLSTIRQISSYLEAATRSTNASPGERNTSNNPMEGAKKVAGPRRLSADERRKILSVLRSADVGSKILFRYRDYIINAAVSDILSRFSPDEMLLASCLSAQQNLFHSILPASVENNSLSFSVFCPFDAAMVWSTTQKEFENDLERWSIAWSGLVTKGWIAQYHPLGLGYFFVRNPPFYQGSTGGVAPMKRSDMLVRTSPSPHNDSVLTNLSDDDGSQIIGGNLVFNWADEFSPPLELACVERLWTNYLAHWARLMDNIFEICLYRPRSIDHLNRYFVHIENFLRIFTVEYLCLFDGDADSSLFGVDDSKQTLANPRDSRDRLSAAQTLVLNFADQLVGKLYIILDHCLPRSTSLEIAVFVFKLLQSGPVPVKQHKSSKTEYENKCVLAEIDIIRQYLRSDKIVLAKERVLRLLAARGVDVDQYYSLAPKESSALFDVVDDHMLDVLNAQNRNCCAAASMPPTMLSQLLSLLGKIELFSGEEGKAKIFFAYSQFWWQQQRPGTKPDAEAAALQKRPSERTRPSPVPLPPLVNPALVAASASNNKTNIESQYFKEAQNTTFSVGTAANFTTTTITGTGVLGTDVFDDDGVPTRKAKTRVVKAGCQCVVS
jgi:hypothetical protein